MPLSGYGDADMIHLFNEDGTFIVPRAARRPSVGAQLNNLCKATGARAVLPFSSFHQYQRDDSIWAQAYTTPFDSFQKGLSPDIEFIPPFSSVDCRTGAVETQPHEELAVGTPRPSTDYGDNWSDQLEPRDVAALEAYFARKEAVRKFLGFVTFKVGGREHTIGMDGRKTRGVTFEVPRGSLMTCIDYRIFDDLLIGNFMKTTPTRAPVAERGAGRIQLQRRQVRRQRRSRDRGGGREVPRRIPSPLRHRLLHQRARGPVAQFPHPLRQAGHTDLQDDEAALRVAGALICATSIPEARMQRYAPRGRTTDRTMADGEQRETGDRPRICRDDGLGSSQSGWNHRHFTIDALVRAYAELRIALTPRGQPTALRLPRTADGPSRPILGGEKGPLPAPV